MASSILDQLDTFGPDRCDQLDYQQATDYTRELTRAHAENFSVVSWLLPRHLRDDFRHVYAFCRWADDLGDETGDPARSLKLLAWWRDELDQCYAGTPRHPVFVALRHTIDTHDIPRRPFDDLIDAFVQDQTVMRYDTWDQVVDYCTRSADPVGRLVLYLCGYRDDARQKLSDQTCTALQLINFWQDVRRDVLERDRVYIPQEIARKYDLDIDLMVKIIKLDADTCDTDASCCDGSHLPSAGMAAIRPAYVNTVCELVERTKPMFAAGRALWPMLSTDVQPDIKLFTYGGESTVRLVEKQGYDTLTKRPSLGKTAKLALVMRALLGKLCGGRRAVGGATRGIRGAAGMTTTADITPAISDADLASAMAYCRDITRTRARNFYYGLKLTPEPKRSALYAVYAFMRRCDDLADEAVEQGDTQAGIERIEKFRQQMQGVLDGGSGGSDVVGDAGWDVGGDDLMLWRAFAHVMRTYPIDPAHLHAMLDGQHADMIKHRYETFAELDHYCYNVAGTVGLVCISVWGYGGGDRGGDGGGDGHADIESIARSRGLALQLTNILRDVVEDAQRGRVYLPADELARFNCDEKQLITGGPGFDALMDYQIKRAMACYDESAALESYLDAACRGTSWAMMRIYRGLLDKIAANPRRVLHERVRLSAWEKTRIALTARWK